MKKICETCKFFTVTSPTETFYSTGRCDHPAPLLGGAAARDDVADFLSCYQFRARKGKMKVELPYEKALNLAERIKSVLLPGCERIEIAGSIRRQKPVIGDIEIVCVPKRPPDLFGESNPSVPSDLDLILEALTKQGRLLPGKKNGNHFKQFQIPSVPGLTLDLFITTPECWGVIFAIRTGSADFSHRLVTHQSAGGLLPDNCRVSGGKIYQNGKVIPTPEEADVFGLIGGWVDPQGRY